MSIYIPICPKCGAYLICTTDGKCVCPRCHNEYLFTIKGVGEYECKLEDD